MENKKLDDNDIYLLSEMAKAKRRDLDIGLSSSGDNIFKVIRELGIKLIYVPIEYEKEEESFFSAVFVRVSEARKKYKFIGLNTNEYYDNQIFALAHELYHYYEETEIHLCRIENSENIIREIKANRFAAEFLLPTERLEKEIKSENLGKLSLLDWHKRTLLRFVARIHCEYKLPFKAIIKRLLEIDAISRSQYGDIYDEATREKDSDYYKIGMGINKEVFELLNCKTMKSGVDGSELESIVRNYEEEIISTKELIEALNLFDKNISDFGIEEEVEDRDLDDLSEMFGE